MQAASGRRREGKAGRELGVKDSGGCESEGAAPGVVQQGGAVVSTVLLVSGAASD